MYPEESSDGFMPLSRQERDAISYRILLSIGDSLDLRKMLSKCLATYMKELSCTMGAILLSEADISQTISLYVAYSIPRSIERNPSFKLLIEEILQTDPLGTDLLVREVPASENERPGTYYIMSIGDIGILVLWKSGGAIDSGILDALPPLNGKLGNACKACIQNENYLSSSQRFMEMANMLPGIILELDSDLRITYVNKRTYEIFKQIDSDQFKPKRLSDFFSEEEHAKINRLISRAAAGEVLSTGDFWMQNSRGERFPVTILLSPIRQHNAIVGYRGIGIDISERMKFQQEQQQLLKKVSDRVRELDGLFAISRMMSDEGKSLMEISEEVVGLISGSFSEDHETWVRIRFGNQVYQREPFKETSVRHSVSIISNGEVSGSLDVFIEEDKEFLNEEISLMETFATQFGNFVARKLADEEIRRLYAGLVEDLETAQSVQTYLLPTWCALERDLTLTSIYVPSTKVGGDLFDSIRISDTQHIMYIADISGHGVQAALMMTAVKSVMNMIVMREEDPSPAHILTRLNAVLSKGLFQENYMTMCCCLVDHEAMTITAVNAGHPPVIIIDTVSQEIRTLDRGGCIPLGWVDDYQYDSKESQTVPISELDLICLYTDGVFDCIGLHGDRLGFENFRDLLHRSCRQVAPTIVPQFVYQTLEDAKYDLASDDFTIACFQVQGSVQPPGLVRPFRYLGLGLITQAGAAAEEIERYMHHIVGDEMVAFRAKLVVDEFLSNVIEHGLKNQGRTEDVILVEGKVMAEGSVRISIFDTGSVWELPARSESLDDFFDRMNQAVATRGRGIQMIHAVTSHAERWRYHTINQTDFLISIE